MKKVLLLLVALMLIGSLALAESIDLGSLTDDELLALHEKVEQAIDERGISEGDPLPNGKYVVGLDIKAGRYVIHVVTGKKIGSVSVFKDDSSTAFNNSILFQDIDKKTTQDVFVSLEDGNVLYVDASKGATISKVEMLE